MKKLRVVVLYNKLLHYRIPIFNLLAERFDLIIYCSYPPQEEFIKRCHFPVKTIPIMEFKSFVIHKKSISELCKGADVVLAYGQITYLNYSLLALKKKDFKLIYWTIGAPASYKRHYGEANTMYYWITDFFQKRADAMVFYSNRGKELYESRGYPKEKLFVANNTVEVEKIKLDFVDKKYLLFIGTLYMEKGIKILLESYLSAYNENSHIPPLHIVGGGAQYNEVRDWVTDHKLDDNIILLGPIYDTKQKAETFKHAIACISPLQAGLSVLESMGYGVPFITYKDAITGGESFNIQNGVNGVLLDDVSDLKNVILDISENINRYEIMGENAYGYYWKNRTPEIMAQGLIDAIHYTLQK